MGTHRDVLQGIVRELQEQCPDCGILLAGSLMRGTEHAGSDIDLFAVFPDVRAPDLAGWRVVHSAPSVRVLDRQVAGIPVACTCVGQSLLEAMTREPWRNRLFARARVLHDPTGIVRRCQAAINEWFRSHPDVDALWDRQEQEHERCKDAVRRGQKATMEFPTWDAFADHVDRLVKGGLVQPPPPAPRRRCRHE